MLAQVMPADSPGRSELLAAAAAEFSNHGYVGATTAGIARRAGVTQPLVHHHFGSKRGLWLAVIDDFFGELDSELIAALARAESAPVDDRIAELLKTFVRFCGRRPQFARLLRVESWGGELFEELYARWLSRFVRFFYDNITEAAQAGLIADIDPALLFHIVVGASGELFAQPQLARLGLGIDPTASDVVERYADAVVQVIFRGISTRPA